MFCEMLLIWICLVFFTLLDWAYELGGERPSSSCLIKDSSDVSMPYHWRGPPRRLSIFTPWFYTCCMWLWFPIRLLGLPGRDPCSACFVPLPSMRTWAVDLLGHVKTYLSCILLWAFSNFHIHRWDKIVHVLIIESRGYSSLSTFYVWHFP